MVVSFFFFVMARTVFRPFGLGTETTLCFLDDKTSYSCSDSDESEENVAVGVGRPDLLVDFLAG